MNGFLRQTTVHWLRELQLHVVTTADHGSVWAKVSEADRMGLYMFVETCMSRPEYRQMLPMSWCTACVPPQYVRTILLYPSCTIQQLQMHTFQGCQATLMLAQNSWMQA
ncbi:TPA: hypothetical protein ACH3X2_013136 [Trebouxia sp. C0005]